MKKYEYKILRILSKTNEQFETELNILGKDGWKVFNVENSIGAGITFYFIREVK